MQIIGLFMRDRWVLFNKKTDSLGKKKTFLKNFLLIFSLFFIKCSVEKRYKKTHLPPKKSKCVTDLVTFFILIFCSFSLLHVHNNMGI